jgi:WD40 repeat protein
MSCRDNHIYSLRSLNPQLGIADDLSSPHLEIKSFYSKMAIFQKGSRFDFPFNSYIACGGTKGITLFPNPAEFPYTNHHLGDDRDISSVNTSQGILLSNGHTSEVTGVAWDSHNCDLTSISDDGTFRIWKPDPVMAKALQNPYTHERLLAGWYDE